MRAPRTVHVIEILRDQLPSALGTEAMPGTEGWTLRDVRSEQLFERAVTTLTLACEDHSLRAHLFPQFALREPCARTAHFDLYHRDGAIEEHAKRDRALVVQLVAWPTDAKRARRVLSALWERVAVVGGEELHPLGDDVDATLSPRVAARLRRLRDASPFAPRWTGVRVQEGGARVELDLDAGEGASVVVWLASTAPELNPSPREASRSAPVDAQMGFLDAEVEMLRVRDGRLQVFARGCWNDFIVREEPQTFPPRVFIAR